jgi:hypothetical protein
MRVRLCLCGAAMRSLRAKRSLRATCCGSLIRARFASEVDVLRKGDHFSI